MTCLWGEDPSCRRLLGSFSKGGLPKSAAAPSIRKASFSSWKFRPNYTGRIGDSRDYLGQENTTIDLHTKIENRSLTEAFTCLRKGAGGVHRSGIPQKRRCKARMRGQVVRPTQHSASAARSARRVDSDEVPSDRIENGHDAPLAFRHTRNAVSLDEVWFYCNCG